MKKVGKTTGSFRYDLNQITYAYTVEVTNRFKGLDLYRRLWSKPSLRGGWRGCKKAKWLSEKALQIAEKREAKGKGKREIYIRLNAVPQRIAKTDKKAFLSDQCKV